jgi:hypothetical protein
MKMIDNRTGLLQCRVCGHTHTAEPAPRWYRGNRLYRWGTFRCFAGCTIEMMQGKKAAEARGREELVMHYTQKGCRVSEIARLVDCSTDFVKQIIRLGQGVKNAKNKNLAQKANQKNQ